MFEIISSEPRRTTYRVIFDWKRSSITPTSAVVMKHCW
jgi:hypothetical protein